MSSLNPKKDIRFGVVADELAVLLMLALAFTVLGVSVLQYIQSRGGTP